MYGLWALNSFTFQRPLGLPMKPLKFASAVALFVSVMVAGLSSSAAYASDSQTPNNTLVYATASEPLGMDPAFVDDSESANIIANVYESLLRFKPDSTDIEPSLAESWTISKNGLTYTFKIRKGVKFHDGTDLNAEAVKVNFDRQSPDNATPRMAYSGLVMGDVASTKVIDDYTFEVKLTRPSTPFLRNMAIVFSAPIVSPKALKDYNGDLTDHPVGTGPYKVVSWDKGDKVILKAFDNYWGEKPKLNEVIYKVIPEQKDRIAALNKGEVDIINSIDASAVNPIRDAGNNISLIEGANVNYMMFNCRPGYVTSRADIRRALSQAVNVPQLVSELYKEYAEPANSFLPTFMSGYSPNTKAVSYDPAAAKHFFDIHPVKKIKIITYSNARPYNNVGGVTLAETIKKYFEQAGLEVQIDVYDWPTFKRKTMTADWDVSFLGWIGDNGDPDNFLNIIAVNDPISNQGLWLNPRYEKLIGQAVSYKEGASRAALYQKADQIIQDDAGVLPISHALTLVAYNPVVHGEVMHPIGNQFFSRMYKGAPTHIELKTPNKSPSQQVSPANKAAPATKDTDDSYETAYAD